MLRVFVFIAKIYSFLASFHLVIALSLAYAANAKAMDSPGEFVQNSGGNLAMEGLQGFNSTPARVASPAFGISYTRNNETLTQVAGASGELGLSSFGLSQRYRMAFFSSYLQMDSLYRRVYSELDFSVNASWLVAGAGYGFSAEWAYDRSQWDRHRYKAGLAFVWSGLSVSALGMGWCDMPLEYPDYIVGLHLSVAERFSVFGEWDGVSFDIGNAVHFSHFSVRSAYRFPGFGVSLLLEFCFSGWSLDGIYGFTGAVWDWFGVSFSRKVTKKSIL